MSVRNERVLVIPAAVLQAAGTFDGLSTRIEYYRPRLLDPAHFTFRPRDMVESDPSWKQIVPYAILRCADQLFHYTRGKRGGETRLLALRSIGVGGHICDEDRSLFGDLVKEGMMRELLEEVAINGDFEESCLGFINDDSTDVGRVHLGVVYVLDLASPHVSPREQALTQAGFAPIPTLKSEREAFESWSQFILDEL